MAVEDVLARISEIEALASRFSARAPGGGTGASFNAVLERTGAGQQSLISFGGSSPASGTVGVALARNGNGQNAALRMLATATGELGVAEEPAGSNTGARISEYRSADSSAAGWPWCATFVSWAARQAGAPIGERGEGYAAVEQIEAWGRRTGRLVPTTAEPRPGDIILYGGRHVGIVESVGPGDRLTTVEGNHRDRVDRVQRTRDEATGYVRI